MQNKIKHNRALTGCIAAVIIAIVGMLSVSRPAKVKTSAGEETVLQIPSAEAYQGCSMRFYVFGQFWQLPFASVTISNSQGNFAVPVGFTNAVGVNEANSIVEVSFWPSDCYTNSINWGYTVWNYCGTDQAPKVKFIPARSWDVRYRALMTCDCPNPGSGVLSEIHYDYCF